MNGYRFNIGKYLIVSIFIIVIKTGCAQKLYVKLGNKEYKKEHYYSALIYYNKLLLNDSLIADEIKIKIADSYYNISNYEEAYKYFTQLQVGKIPVRQLIKYAKILQFRQKYDQAEKIFKTVREKGNTDPRVDSYIKSCNYAASNKDISIMYSVEYTGLITSGESFGTQFYKDGIVFSSESEYETDYVSGYNEVDVYGNRFKDLYFSKYLNGRFQEPTLFSNNLAYRYHEGSVSFSHDYKTMYFTETVKGKKEVLLKIFQVEYINDEWQNKKELSFNGNTYSCAHPSVSIDGKYMFFTSDMPGGQGGKDLYISIKENNTWSKPANLGPLINTNGDEMFPFINNNGVLYFSSDGHPGYGGLDIFSAIKVQGKWTKITNKKKPLNSSGDDFAIAAHPTDNKFLLFSSNRETNGAHDRIYNANKLDVPADTIKGYIKDALTDEPQNKAIVLLMVDSVTGDTISYTTSDDNGNYVLLVPPKDESVDQRNLYMTVEKKGYDRKIIEIEEDFSDTERPLVKNISVELDVKIEKEKILKFYNIYFEYGSAELNSNSKEVLDRVVSILKENRGMKIELSAHTDSRAPADFNLNLSIERANNAKKYITSKDIDINCISAKGYGETRLLNHCRDGVTCDEQEHAVNRRIEIKFLNL